MEERYLQSEESAREMVTALASDDLPTLQKNSNKDIHNLVAALTTSVTATLREVCQNLLVIGDIGQPTENVADIQSLLQLQNVAKEINHSCFRSSERAQNRCLIPSERPLLTSLYMAGGVQVISENDTKSLLAFDNTGHDSELKAETFLQDFINLSKSKNLTEMACKNLLYRKLQSSARALLDSHLDLHDVKYADVTLKDTMRLCEYLYMQRSNPRAAMLSLSKLPKLAKTRISRKFRLSLAG